MTFPSKLSLKEKQVKLSEFGNINKKEEGKIIDDDLDDQAEIEWTFIKRLISYYGHWSRFAFYCVIQITALCFQYRTQYLVGMWAEDRMYQEQSD